MKSYIVRATMRSIYGHHRNMVVREYVMSSYEAAVEFLTPHMIKVDENVYLGETGTIYEIIEKTEE